MLKYTFSIRIRKRHKANDEERAIAYLIDTHDWLEL